MEMNNSLVNSLNELIMLQKQQVQRMDNLTAQQAEQLNIQRQQNSRQNNTMAQSYYNYSSVPYTSYMPPMFDMTKNIRPQAQQFQAYAQNLSGRGQNYGFVDTFFPHGPLSYETRNMLTQDYAGRMSSAAISGAGTITNAGLSLGAYGAFGLVGGTLVGAAASPLVGAFFNNALEQSQIQNAYTKYMQRESYRFINPRESNNNRGHMGFSLGESQQAANFLRTVNTDLRVSDNEMMNLLSQYTESGMLRDVQNMEEFQSKIKSLTKNVKTGALMLNETYESISSLMSEMKKLGINEGSYTNLMSVGKIIGSDLGKSGSEITRWLTSTAGGMTQGTGLDNLQYATRLADTVTYANFMYEDLKNKDTLDPKQAAAKNFVNNNGGVQGVSAMVNQIQDSLLYEYNSIAAGFYDYDSSSDTWNFNRSKYNSMVSGAKSGKYRLEDLHALGQNNLLQYGDLAIKDWQDNFRIYVGNEMDQLQITDFTHALSSAYSVATGANPNDLDMGLSLMLPGLSADQRALYSSYMGTVASQGNGLLLQQKTLSAFQNIESEMAANQRTIFGDIKYGWEGLKQNVGAIGADVSNTFSTGYQNFNDWLYGKQYTDLKFNTNTDWSPASMKQLENEFYDTLKETKESLQGFKDLGYSVDDDMIGLFDIKNANQKTYEYMREYYVNPEKLTGAVGENYAAINKAADQYDLSETILGALVKFSTRSEGQKFFGADKSILEEVARNNSLRVSDPGSATLEQKLQLAAEKISDLVGLYGGNQDLAMAAFYGGQSSVDAQLRAMGYDIDKLRSQGNQSTLSSVDASKINVSNSYTTFTQFKNPNGFDVTNPGYTWDIEGNPVVKGQAVYMPEYNYQRGAKKSQNGDIYYDFIQSISKQIGLSPNALASLMGTESEGNTNARGGSGEIGLTQIMPIYEDWFKAYWGNTIDLGNGQTYTIGQNSQNILSQSGWRAAWENELARPEVGLYVGGKRWQASLDATTTNGVQNPYLAYAHFNGGGGYTNFLKAMAGKEGLDYSTLNASDINMLSNKYASEATNYSSYLNYTTVTGKGKSNLRWSDIYNSGMINPTSTVVNPVDTEVDVAAQKVVIDALTGEAIDANALDQALYAEQQARTADIEKQAAGNLFSLEKIKGSKVKVNWNTFKYPGAYSDSDLKTEARNSSILSKEAEEEIIRNFLAKENIQVGDTLNTKNIVDGINIAQKWYNSTYGEMQKSLKGKQNTWDAMSVADKTQSIELMNLMATTTFGKGLQGEPVSFNKWINDLVGQDFTKLFTEEQRNMMMQIKDGVYSENNKAQSKGSWYKNAVSWLLGGAQIDQSSFSPVNTEGILGMSVEDALRELDTQKKSIMQDMTNGHNTKANTNKLNQLDSMISSIEDQLLRSDDLANLGVAVTTMLGMGKSEKEKFLHNMGKGFLDRGTSALEKENLGELNSKFSGGYDQLENLIKEKLDKDLAGFVERWSQYYDEEMTNVIFNTDSSGKALPAGKELVKFTEDGAWQIQEKDYEVVAGKILNAITAFTEKTEAEANDGAKKTGDDLSEAGDNLTKAVDEFSSKAENSADKLISTINLIDQKVDNLAKEIVAPRNLRPTVFGYNTID